MWKTIIFDRDLDCVVVLDVPGDGKGTKGRKEWDAATEAYSRETNHVIMVWEISHEWYRMNEKERAFVQLSLGKRREILTKWHDPESTWVSIGEETGLDVDLVAAVVAANTTAPNGMVRSEPRGFTIWGAGLGGETGEEAESG